jgi:hypothetical protein
VRNHLDDLLASHTILERLPQVEFELVAPIESDQAGDGDETAVARAEAWAPPHIVEQAVSVIFVRRGAMSVHGVRIGAFSFVTASIPS